jgi:type I restriction enzyme M protein
VVNEEGETDRETLTYNRPDFWTTTSNKQLNFVQHVKSLLKIHGRAAVVLDTGAVTRGSGSKNEDRERNIRKWFVDRDLIDGVILLPENLFYNTTAAGIVIIVNRKKPAARKGKITLVNASRRVAKGRPKNYIPADEIRPIAAMFLKGEPVDGEVAVITNKQAEETDYNLSPSRWVVSNGSAETDSMHELLTQLNRLNDEERNVTSAVAELLKPLSARRES